MEVIYRMKNKVNNKCYIGQTNDFNKRMIGHKSDSNNKNSHSYNSPLSCAIRKYGWNNFENTILEKIPEDKDWKYIDEREKFYIKIFQSLSNQKGYNITIGGQGCPRGNLSFEEKVKLSKIFTLEEIIDIQNLLIQGINYRDILEKYCSKLTHSMLCNINSGLNFKNEKLNYPLFNQKENLSDKLSREQIEEFKQDIISGMTYKKIAEKWKISIGMVSNVNNGKVWKDENRKYPLCIKSHSYLHNLNTWVKDVQNDLINSDLTMVQISEKYKKAYSTIKKINSGSSHRNSEFDYPLTKNRK